MGAEDPFAYYEKLDSQRLKEAFFTAVHDPLPKPEPTKVAPKRERKNFWHAALILPVLAVSLILFNYEIIFVPRGQIATQKNGISLVKDKNFLFSLTREDGNVITPAGRRLFFALPQKEKITLTINSPKQINLQDNSLLIYIKNPGIPFKVSLIARDANFFSNAPGPIVKEISGKDKYLTLNVKFKNAVEPKVNLYRIKQITVVFHPQLQKRKNIIFLKEIAMVKNES